MVMRDVRGRAPAGFPQQALVLLAVFLAHSVALGAASHSAVVQRELVSLCDRCSPEMQSRAEEDMLCPGSPRGTDASTPPSVCGGRARCYQDRPYSLSQACLTARSNPVNITVILPQRSSPPIPAMVMVDFHTGTQSLKMRRGLRAGVGKISIVTQCDAKRFRERIPEMMHVWRGPMVVVVMLRSLAELDGLRATVAANRFLAQWVDVHLVIPETYPDRLYPTNALRSLAEQLALTEWVFVLDADLVPNASAQVFDQVVRDALAGYIPQWRKREIQHNRCPCETQLLVFAVTALEWNRKTVMRPPANLHNPYWFDKAEALCMVQHGLLAPFKGGVKGGGSYIGTDPARWLTASQPYEDLHKHETEPYHIVRTGAPRFSAEFCGWGKDKVARLDDLFMAGYTLHVLPEVTVTHKPHARSASYAGGRPNWGETLQMWGAMRDRRAQVYFSSVADGNAWFANCTKKTNVSKLLGNFSKQILSQKPRWWRLFASQASTDDFFKCMRTVSTRVPSHTIA